MSEKKPLRWPATICSDDDYRPEINHPIRIDGELVFTNGYAMVIIADDGRDAEDYDGVAPGNLRSFSNKRRDGGYVFSVDELRNWCGPHTTTCPKCEGDSPPPCEACDDEGWIDCECDSCGDAHEAECPDCHGEGGACGTCDGDGHIGYWHLGSYGMLDGVYFSPRLLAYILDGAPGDEVRISPADMPSDPFCIDADGWRGLLMPLRGPESDPEIEVIDLAPLGSKVLVAADR